jgi:hypothetical protein
MTRPSDDLAAHMPTNLDDLCARLRAKYDTGRRTMGSASLSSDGKVEIRPSEPIFAPRNPDGPEAADRIEALQKATMDCRDTLLWKSRAELMWKSRAEAATQRADRLAAALREIDRLACFHCAPKARAALQKATSA